MRVLLLGALGAVASAFAPMEPGHCRRATEMLAGKKPQVPQKRDGNKMPDIMTYMDRYKKPAQKPEKPVFEDEIVGRPVPLEPDADGNWEQVLSELWTSVAEVQRIIKIKLNDQEDLLSFDRFQVFAENYKTKRGLVRKDNGQVLSAQVTFPFPEDQVRKPVHDVADHPWVAKLAKRLSYQTFFEHQLGVGQETISPASFSRDFVFKDKSGKWELPSLISDDLPPRRKATSDKEGEDAEETAALRAEVEKSVALVADDIQTPVRKQPDAAAATTPPDDASDKEAAAAARAEEAATTAWSQLILNQCTPWTEGALRFTESMRSCERYTPTAPPPRNFILGKLPPGVVTQARSDLQNHVLTIALPLRGIPDGASAGMVVNGETVAWKQDTPIIFDSTFEYSFFNYGSETAYVALIDFWHPDILEHERKLLGFFWTMWTQDKFHPSTRSKYTRRLARMKEFTEKRAEKSRQQIAMPKKRLERKKDGKGGPGQGGVGGGGGGFFKK